VKRDFTDVRDVVRAYGLLLEHGTTGEIYNVCSGAAVRLADILEMLQSICGVKVKIEIDPARMRTSEPPGDSWQSTEACRKPRDGDRRYLC